MNEDLTILIRSAAGGDTESREKAAELVYHELKSTAEWLMRGEGNHTLQPTALVNQVILKLFDSDNIGETPNRRYFFGAAARSMKRILLDEAKRRKAAKRGGGMERQPFDEILDQYETKGIDVECLNEALSRLELLHERQSEVVHMKWFLELTTQQIASSLEVSETTVESDWRAARAFLYRQLQ